MILDHVNRMAAATLTASAQYTSLPVQNAQVAPMGKVWRFSGTTAYVDADLGASVALRDLAAARAYDDNEIRITQEILKERARNDTSRALLFAPGHLIGFDCVPEATTQLHAIWHYLAAAALLSSYLYFRLEDLGVCVGLSGAAGGGDDALVAGEEAPADAIADLMEEGERK